ncbi:glucoamylase family protein [Duganella violaceipulchra]|uniref:glucoamylase family protein n=1 Tax=Duganella violaceipulchra TaxID=2849652 RepID=UPI001E353604|nr:glucoamylase family protein [Duganella violaceicalia]
MALASPTHPIDRDSYDARAGTYECKMLHGIECLYAGPLFSHQMSHIWPAKLAEREAVVPGLLVADLGGGDHPPRPKLSASGNAARRLVGRACVLAEPVAGYVPETPLHTEDYPVPKHKKQSAPRRGARSRRRPSRLPASRNRRHVFALDRLPLCRTYAKPSCVEIRNDFPTRNRRKAVS